MDPQDLDSPTSAPGREPAQRPLTFARQGADGLDPRLAPFGRRLDALRRRSRERNLRTVARGAEPWVEVDGRRLLNLSSNNYLGLATRPEVRAAAAAAAEQSGAGSGSARLIAGTDAPHRDLERRFAAFKRAEAALLFGSGYLANLGVIPALVGPGDLVLGDELNHASLIDGCRLSRAEFRSYPHRDASALRRVLRQARRMDHPGRLLVVTDTVFSMDGDCAPLVAIGDICEESGALLYVDEAHATGCVGPSGHGLVEMSGLNLDPAVLTMSTLSKALGSLGAVVTGSQLMIDYLINVCRTFVFTTALPPPVIASAVAALDLLEDESELVARLQGNAELLRMGLQDLGFNTLASQTQIVPVLVGDAQQTLEMAAALREHGVFVVAIRPPTVPAGQSRLRASVMATHTSDDIRFALDAFAVVRPQVPCPMVAPR
jgi:8-amino-7-oxononanoate synthase